MMNRTYRAAFGTFGNAGHYNVRRSLRLSGLEYFSAADFD